MTVPAPLWPSVTCVVLSSTRLPLTSTTCAVRLRVAPATRSVLELVKVRWSAAPAATGNVEVSLVRPAFEAVAVSEPTVWPVTVREATPPVAVAVPRPLTVPAPAVLAKATTVVLSAVSRLPLASRISAVSVLVEPEATLELPLV